MNKVIVVLAKSAKYNNFCVAGLDLITKQFIRPISNNPENEDAVPPEMLKYSNGTEIKLFDCIEIKFVNSNVNNPIQPENLYYDAGYRWKKFATSNLEKIIKWRGFDNSKYVFYNTERFLEPNYVKHQRNNQSLMLLPVTFMKIKVEIADDGHKKFFAHFDYNGIRYRRLSVGDITVRNIFSALSAGEYPYKNEAAVLFSLTNPYKDNRCYKMLAQVF